MAVLALLSVSARLPVWDESASSVAKCPFFPKRLLNVKFTHPKLLGADG